MEALEAIAYILAGEKDLAVKEQDAYSEAEALIAGNSRLAAWLERERQFFSTQEGLLSGFTLSHEARERILTSLEEAQIDPVSPKGDMISFPRRTVWACAAAVVILLMGITYLAGVQRGTQQQYAGVQQNATVQAFRQFSVNQVEQGFHLDYRNPSSQQVVNWLTEERSSVPDLSDEVAQLPTMGCKVLGWNEHKVSLICFEQAKGETVHLFVIDRYAHDPMPAQFPAGVIEVEGRDTRCWQDREHTYIMVAHDKGQALRSNSI